MPRRLRGGAAIALLLALAACGRVIPPGSAPTPRSSPTPRPAPITGPITGRAIDAGVHPGPAVSGLAFTRNGASAALGAFRTSCGRLTTRSDTSGLTRPTDWHPACAAARGWSGDASAFFRQYFETARIGNGSAHATGYYEPEIAGARRRQPGYDVPVYSLPADLVRARPGDARALPDGRQPLGRYDESGRFVPYYDRAAIEDGALAGKGLEIAWVADPVEFFFLQVQGSGRLRAADGTIMRIGYAGTNGRNYAGIGSLMRDRGLVGSGPGQYPGSMQGIMRYLRDNPRDGAALMRLNQSWVFFRELTGEGPVGALGVPVRGRATVAADPAFVPLGAPVWLDVDRSEADGLWIAQDTGGAIKGANRFDTFWGAGQEARTIAGGMSARGRALLLLPKGTLQRLRAR